MNEIQSPPLQNPVDAGDVKLPYFDYLLSLLKDGNEAVERSFGRHVHWGYWERPESAELSTADFEQAAENLSQQVCLAGNVDNGQNVLDVGCGFGGTVAYINDHFIDMKLVGLNLDERQLIRARERVLPVGENSIQFQQGNACELPFADTFFDVVLAVECIFHFPDREQFFKEAWRVLRPGGYMALSDFVPRAAVAPLMRIKLPEPLKTSFYGADNKMCSAQHYRRLAKKTQFDLHVSRDITANTLPTYPYIKQLARQQTDAPKMAKLETAAIEWLSRFRLVNYYIYGFHKPV
ncbi:MAG: methyltransferase domain-containing protein [Methylococcales bacterium]|nr:methyltransferase domain-containing protein [Methylococcales bacterium]MDD5631005.1 methyltransferase domain-containing protein [Methylococcales bacterium]